MADGYRDPLAAAHARIAELEEKIATLETERASTQFSAQGRFPELETKVAALKLRTDDTLAAQRRVWLTRIGILFPLLSAVFSFLHLPIYATVASVVFIGMMLFNLRNQAVLKSDRKLLAEAQKELADAHRIAELESKLAEKEERARVAPEAEPLSDDEPAASERGALRS